MPEANAHRGSGSRECQSADSKVCPLAEKQDKHSWRFLSTSCLHQTKAIRSVWYWTPARPASQLHGSLTGTGELIEIGADDQALATAQPKALLQLCRAPSQVSRVASQACEVPCIFCPGLSLEHLSGSDCAHRLQLHSLYRGAVMLQAC